MTTKFISQAIPAELKVHKNWVAWIEKPRPGQSKPAKVPTDPKTGRNASPTNPATWADYATAEAFAQHNGCGVGFVLTHNTGFCCIDLDATGDEAILETHREILNDANAAGLFIEQSPSGEGWHIWAQHYEQSKATRAVRGVECYTNNRFMTVTGHHAMGQISMMPETLSYRLAPCFAEPTPNVDYKNVEPQASDDEIFAKANERYQERFEALNNGEWSSLHPSQSEADFEFGFMLARYTQDDQQWFRLFLQSVLAKTLKRKQTKKHAEQYLRMTYEKARVKADEENYHIEFGRSTAERLLASWHSSKAAMFSGMLEPCDEFAKKKVSPLKLVKGIFGEGCMSVLYGAPGAGKSFLALDISVSVATGQPFMGRVTRQGPVIYAVGEGVSGLRLRVRAILKVRGLSNPPIFFMPHAISTPDETEMLGLMLDHISVKCRASPVLLIIDTLSRFFGDGDDENSAKDMRRFVGAIGLLIAKFPNLHVMIVHHSGKDQDRGMRGSSALQGAADTVIQCSKHGEEHIALVEKQKDGQDNISLPFALEQVDLGEDDDGEPITTCVVVHDQMGEGNVRPLTGGLGIAARVLLAVKQNHPPTAAGNLEQLFTDIPIKAFYEGMYKDRPQAKQDTVRKNARRQLESLREKKLIYWEDDGVIRLLPALHNAIIK